MAMDDRSWARHASDWSVYSRIAGGVGIFAALASGHAIGWWAVIPCLLALAWTWLNPRLFPPPSRADGWAQRGVLGERVFLNRDRVPIPPEFVRVAWISTGICALFVGVAIWGLVAGEIVTGAISWLAAMLAKIWFVDRCAMLWDLMKGHHPVYAAWERADWSAGFNRFEDPVG